MLDKLIGPVTGLLSEFIVDKDQQNKLAHEIATMAEKQAAANALAQIEVNKIEAKGNWFQSSWRPLVGWVCAVAFAWHFVFQSLLVFILTYAGAAVPELPVFDMSSLLTVLGGLLGLGSLRTFEKVKKVNK